MTLADAKVFKLRSDSNGDIAGERPGGRGPHEQALPLAINQREAKRDTGMRELLVTLGDDLVLAQPRPPTAGAHSHPLPPPGPAPPPRGDRVVLFETPGPCLWRLVGAGRGAEPGASHQAGRAGAWVAPPAG